MRKEFWIFCILIIILLDSYSQSDTLRVAIEKHKNEQILKSTYVPMINYIAEKCDMIPKITIVSKDNIAYQLNENKFDLAIFRPFTYIKIRDDENFKQINVFATHEAYGNDTFIGIIAILKTDTIESIKDLKGKSFCFVKPTSTSGFLYPMGMLKLNGIDTSMFSHYDFSGGHYESISKLLSGEFYAIAVNYRELKEYCRRNKELSIKNNFSILIDYMVPNNAYTFSPHLDESIKNKIKHAMFYHASNDHENANRLFDNILGIQKWKECDDGFYNSLREYLNIERIKPYVDLEIIISDSASSYFNKKGESGALIKAVKNRINNNSRFSNNDNSIESNNNFIIDAQLEIEIANKDFNSYMLSIKINKKLVLDTTVSGNNTELLDRIPKTVIYTILKDMDIKTELKHNGKDWFITYGKDDGINKDNYQFIFELDIGKDTVLQASEVYNKRIIFSSQPFFTEDNDVTIKYFQRINKDSDGDGLSDYDELNKYFTNPNNPDTDAGGVSDGQEIFQYNTDPLSSDDDGFWGSALWDKLGLIISIILAMVTIGITSWLTIRKKKRFRMILYKVNDLLKTYIEGKTRIKDDMSEKKELIGKYLEKGQINETQFMILTKRIEEIQNIIDRKLINEIKNNPEIKKEIEQVLADGIITEKEFIKLQQIFNK